MLLVIDVGNTQSVVGVYDGATLTRHFRLSSDHHRTKDEYGVLLGQMLRDAEIDAKELTAGILASVVPPLTRVFERMCVRRLGFQPLVVGPGVKTGMPIHYESPRDVGADRIVNGVAGYERYGRTKDGPCGVIIVDFGTATTFDVISPKGEYLGGAIAPGVIIATEALFIHASKLPRVNLALPETCLGKNTVHSMQAGILYGYVALVDGMVARLKAELDFVPRVIATGGVASLISGESQAIEEVDGFLTLEGLRLIYMRNQRASSS